MHTSVPRPPRASTRRGTSLAFGAALAVTALVTVGCGSDSKAGNDPLAEQLIEQAATAPSNEPSATVLSTLTSAAGEPSSDASSAGSVGSAGSAASAASAGSDATQPEIVTIDKTVWWGGFKITVATAERSSNALSTTINVSIAFENLTSEVERLDHQDVVLTVGTQSYLGGVAQTPSVPAQSRTDAVLDFLIDDSFVVDEAVLTFGRPDTNQAVVPFGSATATSFEPEHLAVNATLTTSTETVQLTGCTIDASYAPAEKGTFIVRLPLSAKYTGGGSGGDLISPTQFALRSPSGSSVAGLAIAPGDIVAEPVYTGQDLTGKVIAFKIQVLEPGTWAISYTDSLGEVATADITVA